MDRSTYNRFAIRNSPQWPRYSSSACTPGCPPSGRRSRSSCSRCMSDNSVTASTASRCCSRANLPKRCLWPTAGKYTVDRRIQCVSPKTRRAHTWCAWRLEGCFWAHGRMGAWAHGSTLFHTVAARGDPRDTEVMMTTAVTAVSFPRARRAVPTGNVVLPGLSTVAAVPGAVGRGHEEVGTDQGPGTYGVTVEAAL